MEKIIKVIYECKICNYKTHDKRNFYRHEKTLKHIDKSISVKEKNPKNKKKEKIHDLGFDKICNLDEIDTNKCKSCGKIYSTKSNMFRHEKTCLINSEKKIKVKNGDNKENKENKDIEDKDNIKLKEEIFKLTIENEKIKLEKEKEKEIKEIYEKLLKEAGSIMNKTTNLASKNADIANNAQIISMSALKYVNVNYKNAPSLTLIENFNINDLDYDDDEEKLKLVEIIIYHTKMNSLHKLLGDHIIKIYKKDDPSQQSFHSTDVSRLNYIVKRIIEEGSAKNNYKPIEEWEIDKMGKDICESLINPLIEKIICILRDYQEILSQKNILDLTKYEIENMEIICKIIMYMESGQLETNINKYIAPFFNLKKIK